MKHMTSRAIVTIVTLIAAGGLTLSAQGNSQGRGRGRGRGGDSRDTVMTGTFELDRSRGDDPARAADLATRNAPQAQRDQAYQDLFARLQPPAMLSIERRGRTVTISSPNGQPATFDADGQTRNETQVNRRVTATRAVFAGDTLTVSSRGNRATDFLVTFEPGDDGDELLVTRQVTSLYTRQNVTTRSYYRRVAAEPRWDLYTAGSGVDARARSREFVVPDGTRITAILDTPISTRTARSGDRFSMTVQAPNEYRDARIEGVVASVDPAGNNRPADMHLDFNTIQLRNGQTASLEAVVDTVRTPGGDTLQVDASGQTGGRSRTTAAIEQGALGAAIGGVIGVIAGGGKGAVIGAVIGGAGGAILAKGSERSLELPVGTEVTLITSSSRSGR